MRATKLYPLNQSPLYKTTSKRKLADVLQISLRDLLFIAALPDNYREWPLKQKAQDALAGLAPPKKKRLIQQPKAIVNAVQKRIAQILARIKKPDYVYSSTKHRSYFDNAKAHSNPHPAIKVDIRDFYQSVKEKSVKDFFEREMKCASDVAHLLARLCCTKGFLPTGSAVSPTLSYFSCSPMFERIASAANEHGLTFTLYVDDMVFSGEGANRDFLKTIWPDLSRNQLIGHKIAYFASGQPKVITGAVIWNGRTGVPNKRQKRIRFFERAFRKARDPDHIELLGKTLLGQYREAERIQRGSRHRAKPVQDRLDATRSLRFAELTEVPVRKQRPKKRKIVLRRSKKLLLALRENIAALRESKQLSSSALTND